MHHLFWVHGSEGRSLAMRPLKVLFRMLFQTFRRRTWRSRGLPMAKMSNLQAPNSWSLSNFGTALMVSLSKVRLQVTRDSCNKWTNTNSPLSLSSCLRDSLILDAISETEVTFYLPRSSRCRGNGAACYSRQFATHLNLDYRLPTPKLAQVLRRRVRCGRGNSLQPACWRSARFAREWATNILSLDNYLFWTLWWPLSTGYEFK